MFPIIKYFALFALVAALLLPVLAAPSPSSATSWPTFATNQEVHSMTFGSDFNLGGTIVTQQFLNNVCTEVPATLNDNLRSVSAPAAGITCKLYADPQCKGHSVQVPDAGSADVLDATLTKDGVTSVLCYAAPNVHGAAIAITYAPTVCAGSNCPAVQIINGQCTEALPNMSSFVAPAGVECTLYDDWLCLTLKYAPLVAQNGVSVQVPKNTPMLTYQCQFTGKWATLNSS